MKTKELEEKIKKEIKAENFVNLRNWLDENFKCVWFNGHAYTDNPAAAEYDRHGSCTNIYIVCEDGYVEYPF